MPLPIVVALAWLVEFCVQVVARWAARAIIEYGVELAWEKAVPFLIALAEKYAPTLVKYTMREAFGFDVELPLTPENLTRAVNERLAIPGFAFRDITDRREVREDCEALAMNAIKQALPGINIKRLKRCASNREDLRAALLAEIRREIKTAMSEGSSTLVPEAATVQIFASLQAGYDWKPHVNATPMKNVIGRMMANWYTRHLTRTWVAR